MADAHALRTHLRRRIADGDAVVAPGVFDALSARLAEEAEFEAVHASGGAIARSSGLPDLGLLAAGEVLERLGQIANAVGVSVIADADTGFGNALNVRRTVQQFERAGVAALHLEDQVFPKRCGHHGAQELITAVEMEGKIRAALEARTDEALIVIARTDARSVAGFDEAVRRAQAYAAAGADVIFVEALRSEEEVRALPSLVRAPLLYDVTYSGKSPVLHPRELAALGYRIVIFPADLQLAAMRGMEQALRALKTEGLTPETIRATFAEREAIVRLERYLELQCRYAPKEQLKSNRED